MTIPDSLAPLRELLDTERGALLARVAGVSDSQRDQRPDADRWSVAEVLEHLATVERSVVRLLVARLLDAPAIVAIDVVIAPQMDAARIARLRNRGERTEAPDRVKPRGALNARAALEALVESRASLASVLGTASVAQLDGASHVHPLLGALTLRGWVQFIAHHEARHAEQIGEIAQALAVTSGRGDP